MRYEDLRNALKISDGGTVVITADTLTANIAELLATCYSGGPITLTRARPGPDDGTDETVVVTGRSSFLGVADAQVELRATADAAGNAQVCLRYTLLDDAAGVTGWKFANSFPNLPGVIDWNKTENAPDTVPLDDLSLSNAAYVVVSQAQQERRFKVALRPGINFVSQMAPTGIVGIIENLVGHTTPLVLHGTILLPSEAGVTLPLDAYHYPWDATTPVPGIQLQADLGPGVTIGSMDWGGVLLRIYSPTSAAWLKQNATYKPVLAYAGTLDVVPSEAIKIHLVAPQQIGGNELALYGRFENVSVAKLASLVGIAGTNSLISSMPSQIREMGDALGKLELIEAGITLSLTEGQGFQVGTASFAIGMPALDWNVWDDHFKIDTIICTFAVSDPFSDKRQVSVVVAGKLEIEGVPIRVLASNQNGFTVYAELADKLTIPLEQFMRSYGWQFNPPGDLTVDAFNVTVVPFKSYAMALAMAEAPNPWVIPLGPTQLTISDVVLALNYPKNGPLSGTFGGSMAFGDTLSLAARYDFPGNNFVARGLFPEIRLREILAKLANEDSANIPDAFDLTFLNSSALVQKSGQNYVFRFGTQLEGFGLFALEVRKRGASSWGLAAGLDLSAGLASDLPALAPLKFFEDFFALQKLLVIVSTFDDLDGTFQFPDTAAFNNPELGHGQIKLRGKDGLIAGLNVYAQWAIATGDKQQKLLKELLGIEDLTLSVALQVGKDPGKDSRLAVTLDAEIEQLPVRATIGGRLQGETIELFMIGSMTVKIQGQQQTFSVELDFVENGAFVSGSMTGSTPVTISIEDVEVFKVGNLAMVVGCDWEGIPSLGVAGTLSVPVVADFETSLAVFFDSAEPQKSMVAGAISNFSLKDVIGTLTGHALPSEVDDVLDLVQLRGTDEQLLTGEAANQLANDLDQLKIEGVAVAFAELGFTIPTTLKRVFLNVEKANHYWYLTALNDEGSIRHYQIERTGPSNLLVSLEAQLYCVPQTTHIGQLKFTGPDFYLSGALRFFGIEAKAKVNINPNKGILVDAQMNKIVIGTESLFSLTAAEGEGGPHVSICTFDQPSEQDESLQKPHVLINGKVEILGLVRATYAFLTSSGVKFDMYGNLIPGVWGDLHGHFTSLKDLNFGGEVRIGVGTIDLGPLGKIDIDTGVGGKLDLTVKDGVISAAVSAYFQFAGHKFAFDVALNVDTASLLNLVDMVYQKVKDALWDFLQDVAAFAKAVAEGLIRGIADLAQAIADHWPIAIDKAQQIAEDAWGIAKKACATTQALASL